MEMPFSQSSQDILTSARRLPWGRRERTLLFARLPGSRPGGRGRPPIPALDPIRGCDLEHGLREGYVMLRSTPLAADFLLVNTEAGRNFLGERRTTVFSFIAPAGQDAWMPFLAPDSLKTILLAIGNMGNWCRKAPPSLPAYALGAPKGDLEEDSEADSEMAAGMGIGPGMGPGGRSGGEPVYNPHPHGV